MDLFTLMQVYKYIRFDTEKTQFFKNNHIEMKDHEFETINSLLICLKKNKISNADLVLCTDNFWIGYKIPQIGEEFDLLRFGNNYNINIELKSNHDIKKMTKQINRKKYYLNFLEIPTLHFIYSSENNVVYQLIKDESEVVKIEFKELWEFIVEQKVNKNSKNQIDSLFNPSNYLISPFNTTEKFIKTEYFLTNHQDKIQKEILEKINCHEIFFMVEGAAGTGKTLLIYDLIKKSMQYRNVMVIHTGKLNEGHKILNDSYNWNIKPIKKSLNFLDISMDLIVIDESQRINIYQLDKILQFCKKNSIPCIFSLDKNQCLHKNEMDNDVQNYLYDYVEKENRYKLREKIRSNKELAGFIKLMNRIPNKNFKRIENEDNNIKIKYFDDRSDALTYVDFLKSRSWVHITYSNSLYYKEEIDELIVENDKNSHDVVGQEFEKVVVMIDSNFGYIENENKTSLALEGVTPSYYHAVKMLFQNSTRARKKICIVIINNQDFFNNISKVLTRF